MILRTTVSIRKNLPPEDGSRQMEELRAFLQLRGWEILAEGGDLLDEDEVDPLEGISHLGPPEGGEVPEPAAERCPHCSGAGQIAGAGTCSLCQGSCRVVVGTRHPGRCCE